MSVGTFAPLSKGGEEQPDYERVRNVDKERPDYLMIAEISC